MNLTYLAITFASAFTLGVVCIPIYIRAARSRNIIDIPNERSSHSVPTPRGGGIFIPIGLISATAFCIWIFGVSASNLTLLATLCLVAAIGFIDDIVTLPSILRLAVHLACGIGVAWTTLPVTSLVITTLTIALATIWLVGCLNIFNFMDGIDGIAASQGLVAATVWFVIFNDLGFHLGSVLTLALLGSLLAFLFFNWSPAKVFMGDSSSGTLGFIFGAFPLIIAAENWQEIWIHLNYGALALFPFLFDGTYTLIRRLLRKENVLQAHRSHLYQRWNQAGKTHRFITCIYSLWSASSAAACLLAYFSVLPLWISWIIACTPAFLILNHSKNFPNN